VWCFKLINGFVGFNRCALFSKISVEGILIQNTHESICGAGGKRRVFCRFESQPPRL